MRIISLTWNQWLMESKAWMAPPRLTATTAAPTLRASGLPFLRMAYPARSIRACVVAVQFAKYVGEPMRMPSAASIFSMHSLRPSSLRPEQRLSRVSAHLRQAVQPTKRLWASCTSSVSMPSASSSTSTRRSRMAVLPSLRELPLNATTFIGILISRVMAGRGARARLHDVERAGEVGQMALRLTQRAGDAGQREGEHAPPEGAHEVVVETVAALVVPAVRVREDFVERTLVDEREDARARAGDDAVDALPPLRVLGFAGLLAERPRHLAQVGHPETVVEQEVVGGLALRGMQQTCLVQTLPEPLAHSPLEVVAGLHAGRQGRLAYEQHAQPAARGHNVGKRRYGVAVHLDLGAMVHRTPLSHCPDDGRRVPAPACRERSTRAGNGGPVSYTHLTLPTIY